MKKLASSYVTLAGVSFCAATLHVWWLIQSSHAGEVISGFGATIIALGLWVAARPFIRTGIMDAARQQVQAPQFQAYLDSDGKMISEAQAAYNARVASVIPDIVTERVLAVLVIVLGTVLNGYGAPLARLLQLPV